MFQPPPREESEVSHQVEREPQEPKEESEEEIKPIKEMFETGRSMSPIFKLSIIVCICILTFFIRIFSVIRYESVIHEFDPWFNFRTTKYLT